MKTKESNQEPMTSPPLRRSSMAYQPRPPRKLFKLDRRFAVSLWLRRLIFLGLVFASTFLGGKAMATILSSGESAKLSWAIICIFSVLFSWIAATFWTVLLGFLTLCRPREPWAVHRPAEETPLDPQTRIAVIMPVYNEDIPRIFSGLQAMYESLRDTGYLNHFDFFILSDSTRPTQYTQEEKAWAELCRRVDGHGRIFYRRRKIRLHKKSGNVSDFCRRWGRMYKYLLPLDADSLVSGRLMVDLVRIMEERPKAGIVQTSPKGINQVTLASRLQQFTSHAYGPLHLAGSNFWQLNDAGFWGHNAIIRMEPFIKYCALPTLSGSAPFGGEVLSHDFIEAALMRRAGWDVWLAYDLVDSYEELPPNLIEDLRRDNRWSQGNLQHLRLMFWRGFSFGHRLLFLNGNMAYFSALLWFLLLVLMTLYAIVDFFYRPQYFPEHRSLFPQWPIHHHDLSIHLLLVTIVFLFGPKLLSLIWLLCSGQDLKGFGGGMRLVLSILFETMFSIFLAPIKMIFHTWFILSNLFARKLEWNKQQRDIDKISIGQALKHFGLISVGAVVWGVIAYTINQSLFLWLLPIIIPLAFSIPLVVISSYRSAGLLLRRLGLFLTPPEVNPPKEVRRLNELLVPEPKSM